MSRADAIQSAGRVGAPLRYSRFMLGTVQFGLRYGIANRAGQPAYRDVLDILTAAVEGGVDCCDTAASYGTSEEILGQAIRELRVEDRLTVVTKLRPLTPEQSGDARLAARAIEASVDESRRRLRLDCLPLVLFHREFDAVHLDSLLDLCARGSVRQAGVSCDNRPGPAARFAASTGVAALQIPASLLDRRHLRGGSMKSAAGSRVAVFVRSVYLQGLLLMPEARIPKDLQPVVPVRRALESLAAQAGVTLAELAVRHMLRAEGVTSLVMGVDTVEQLRENLAMFNRGPLEEDLAAAIEACLPELPELVLTPALWPAMSSSSR